MIKTKTMKLLHDSITDFPILPCYLTDVKDVKKYMQKNPFPYGNCVLEFHDFKWMFEVDEGFIELVDFTEEQEDWLINYLNKCF